MSELLLAQIWAPKPKFRPNMDPLLIKTYNNVSYKVSRFSNETDFGEARHGPHDIGYQRIKSILIRNPDSKLHFRISVEGAYAICLDNGKSGLSGIILKCPKDSVLSQWFGDPIWLIEDYWKKCKKGDEICLDL